MSSPEKPQDKKQERDEDRWDEEMEHLKGIIRSFHAYAWWHGWYVNELEQDLQDQESSILALIPDYGIKLQGMFA